MFGRSAESRMRGTSIHVFPERVSVVGGRVRSWVVMGGHVAACRGGTSGSGFWREMNPVLRGATVPESPLPGLYCRGPAFPGLPRWRDGVWSRPARWGLLPSPAYAGPSSATSESPLRGSMSRGARFPRAPPAGATESGVGPPVGAYSQAPRMRGRPRLHLNRPPAADSGKAHSIAYRSPPCSRSGCRPGDRDSCRGSNDPRHRANVARRALPAHGRHVCVV